MNQRIYKSFGIFLIALTFIVIAVVLFSQIVDTRALSRGYGQFDYLYDIATDGVRFSFIVLILGFFPGLFFYRFGKEITESNKIAKSALVLQMISVIVMLFVGSTVFLSCINGCDGLGEGIFFATFGIPALIIYCIGILLLIIYKFKTGNFKLRVPEKFVLSALLLMILFVGIIYTMALREDNYRSVERCDNKQNVRDKDECHYFLSREKPDLVICEKISDTSGSIGWKDQCYIAKAQYYKDPSFCAKIQGEQLKENCLDIAR